MVVKNQSKKAHDVLLLALACGASVEAAASQAGLSPRTVYRRLATPGFRSQLSGLRADLVQRATGMLSAATLEAVKTLISLQEATTSAAVRLGAARTIIELGLKLREEGELSGRLAALEAAIAPPAEQHARSGRYA